MAHKVKRGRHFLNVPGPSNVPDRVLRAMDHPVIDHRSQEFFDLVKEVCAGYRRIFRTEDPVAIYPSSGTGAWEAAFLNTLSPGDKILGFESGQFATLWKVMAERHGLSVDFMPGDWRHPVDPAEVERRLVADKSHSIKAVTIVHSETSTGIIAAIPAIRQAMDRAKHPALLMVDSISSAGVHDYRHTEWGVDVTICGSQKGLMLPPGIAFNALSPKALAASRSATLPKAFWAWDEIVEMNKGGFWPSTPNTNLLYALSESLDMLLGEGLDSVFARHRRWAEGVRSAVRAWGLPIQCDDPAVQSPVLTGVVTPVGVDADQLRRLVHDRFDLSLGTGLGKVKGRMFRIGHLGDSNDLTLVAALAGVEMGLKLAGVPVAASGVQTAMDFFATHPSREPLRAAA